MRRRIFWGAFGVAAAVLALSAIAGAVVRQQLVDQSQAELTRQAEVAARLVGNPTAFTNLDLGRASQAQLTVRLTERVLSLVREVGGHDYVEAARVTPNGVIALVEDPSLLGLLPTGLDNANGLELELEGSPVIAAVRTVVLSDQLTLRIAIGRDEPLLDSRLFSRPMWVALLIGAVLALVLAYGVSRRLGRRLDPIEDAARAIADGDFGARVEVTGDDELGRVGEAFNEMASRLEGAQQRERDFLMNVGHDLRTPLTTIRGYAEGLDGGDIDADDLPRVAAVLDRQTDRLSRLIEDLMLLARLEAREFTLRPERVDVAAHLKEIVDGYRTRADELHIRLEAAIEHVGDVMIDPDRIGQVLGNLVDNAFRYAPEGGTVTVSLGPHPGGFIVAVSDTGPGIDAEDVSRVFDRLYVAQRYRPVRPEGSGLGLSIVKELVDAMGGLIDVRSEPGSGTTIAVTMSS